MKKRLFCLALLVAWQLLASNLMAQSLREFLRREHPTAIKKNKRYFSVGGFLAALHYFGDLAPRNKLLSTNLAYTRPGIGFSAMYRFSAHSSLRSSFMWGRLRGDDQSADVHDKDAKFRHVRNLHFRNDIKELSVTYLLDLKAQHRTFVTRENWSPYLFAGIALFHHNPKAKVPELDALHYDLYNARPIQQQDPFYGGVSPGDWIALQPLHTEGQNQNNGQGLKPYSSWQLAIPLGIGIRYRLQRHTDLSLEIGYHQTFTDYLDDVSGDYINPEDFGTGPRANLARVMHDRSKEPNTAVAGKPRNLAHIQGNIHSSSPYGQVPAEFGSRPYELTNGYGNAGDVRGKSDYDIYVVIKLQVIFIIGRGQYY